MRDSIAKDISQAGDIGLIRVGGRLRAIFAGLFVAMILMTGMAIERYMRIEERMDVRVAENVLWAAAQNEIELGRMLSTLADGAANPEEVNRARLEERFDILWSRLTLYREGALARSIADQPELRATLDALFTDVKAIEPIVFEPLRVKELSIARNMLSRHVEPLRHFTTAALNIDRVERETLVETHAEIKKELGLLALATVCILLTFFYYLIHSERRARHHLKTSITARSEADAAWRQLDEAIENISEGFVLYDAQDRLIRCNQKYREVYSLSAPALKPGETFENILRYGIAHGQYQEALGNPEAWLAERLRKRRDISEPFEQPLGDGRWLMVSDRRTRDGGRVGIRTDITEIKRNVADLEAAREHLRAQAERMSALAVENRRAHEVLNDAIESIGEGFVLYDADDRLVTCNSRYRSYFEGVAHLLRPGLRFHDFLEAAFDAGHLDIGEDRQSAIEERIRRRRQQDAQAFLEPLTNGRWLQVSNRLTRNGGVVTVFNDITELKNRELALIEARNDLENQAKRMKTLMEIAEAASRSKSDFLAMISHEIRTPMNAVIGLANLLGESTLDSEQKGFVQGIEESGVHLLGLINDILDFSRLEAEKSELEIAPVSIREVLGSACNMLTVLAQKKNLPLMVEIDPELPDWIESDGARLSQIVINLAGNAIKFTRKGQVSVRAERISETPGEVSFRILVADTGIGIPEDMRRRIFQPFERSRASDREHISGTGLGLAITHRLVGLMGGTIRLVDTTGPGTTFEVELTCRRAAGKPDSRGGVRVAAVSPVREIADRPLKVLVAEDTPASQLVIRTMLERRGHHVDLVDNGEAAIHAAQKGGYDFALLDIQMPVKTGYEAAEAIRRLPGAPGMIPIIALSAQAFATDRQRSIEAGFNEHLAKPVRPADLDRLIERVRASEFVVEPKVELDLEDDSDMLGELFEICGPEVFQSLLDVAIRNLRSEKAALLEAHAADRTADLRKIAHKLAGILGQYGSHRAAEAATRIETAPDELVSNGIPLLGMMVDEAISHIERWRQKANAA